jgi:hypothetical protein
MCCTDALCPMPAIFGRAAQRITFAMLILQDDDAPCPFAGCSGTILFQ